MIVTQLRIVSKRKQEDGSGQAEEKPIRSSHDSLMVHVISKRHGSTTQYYLLRGVAKLHHNYIKQQQRCNSFINQHPKSVIALQPTNLGASKPKLEDKHNEPATGWRDRDGNFVRRGSRH